MMAATEGAHLVRGIEPSAVIAHRHWVVVAAAVTVVAIVLRGVALTARAFVFDETFSVFIASHPLDRLLALVAANDPHPPLYYLLLRFWMVLFGDGEVGVRALSVLISTSVVLVTWLLGRRLIGPLPALLAAGLVIASPAQVASGQEARMYGLLALTSLASWWAMHAAAQTGQRRAWMIYALVAAAMLYTHYFGFFVWISQGTYLAWRRTTGAADWRRWLSANLLVLLLFLPWLPAFIDQLAAGRAWPVYRPPLSRVLVVDTLRAMTTGGTIVAARGLGGWTVQTGEAAGIPLAGAAAAAILGLAAIRSRSSTRDTKGLLLFAALCPLLLALTASLRINVFSPRYLVFITPPIALLMGAGIAAVSGIGSRRGNIAAAALALAVLAPSAVGLRDLYRTPGLDEFDWRQVSRTLAALARPDDAIVFLPGYPRIPVNYYFRGPQPRVALTPQGADVVGAGGVRGDAVVAFLARHPRVWILTVPPVPASLDSVIGALRQHSYGITRQGRINKVRLILLERMVGK